jgi:hypothetical protein
MIRAKKGNLPPKMLPVIEVSEEESKDELSSIVVDVKTDKSEENENADN